MRKNGNVRHTSRPGMQSKPKYVAACMANVIYNYYVLDKALADTTYVSGDYDERIVQWNKDLFTGDGDNKTKSFMCFECRKR